MSDGVGRRCGSDPALPWLSCRPAVVAVIQPLAWEATFSTGVALKSQNKYINKIKIKKNFQQSDLSQRRELSSKLGVPCHQSSYKQRTVPERMFAMLGDIRLYTAKMTHSPGHIYWSRLYY